MASLSTITDVERERHTIISYMFECGNAETGARCVHRMRALFSGQASFEYRHDGIGRGDLS